MGFDGPMTVFDQAWWEERYRSAPALWSGQANVVLVDEVAALQPGRALDAGCGEGGDALWLAEQGWRVDAVDISTVALERAALEAERRGLADRVRWQQADLTSWSPDEPYDLVTASFLRPPSATRGPLYARLAAAVAPGGTLLLVQHHPSDADVVPRTETPDLFITAEEIAAALDAGEWEVAADDRPRTVTHDGHQVTVRDAVLVARHR